MSSGGAQLQGNKGNQYGKLQAHTRDKVIDNDLFETFEGTIVLSQGLPFPASFAQSFRNSEILSVSLFVSLT
jgi:hypothetical protein